MKKVIDNAAYVVMFLLIAGYLIYLCYWMVLYLVQSV